MTSQMSWRRYSLASPYRIAPNAVGAVVAVLAATVEFEARSGSPRSGCWSTTPSRTPPPGPLVLPRAAPAHHSDRRPGGMLDSCGRATAGLGASRRRCHRSRCGGLRPAPGCLEIDPMRHPRHYGRHVQNVRSTARLPWVHGATWMRSRPKPACRRTSISTQLRVSVTETSEAFEVAWDVGNLRPGEWSRVLEITVVAGPGAPDEIEMDMIAQAMDRRRNATEKATIAVGSDQWTVDDWFIAEPNRED